MSAECQELVSAFLGAVEDMNDVLTEQLLNQAGRKELRKQLILATNQNMKTALHFAAQKGNSHLVLYLIKEGADIDAKDANDEGVCDKTPLHYAAKNSHFPTVVAMLQNGAQVDVADASGMTPLHHATTTLIYYSKMTEVSGKTAPNDSTRSWDVIKQLIAYRADCNKSDLNGICPILMIAEAQMWEQCKHIVRLGGNVTCLHDDQKVSLLHYVTNLSDLQISDYTLDDTDAKVRMILYNTIRLNNTDLFKLLINKWFESSQDPLLSERIHGILAEVYEELKYKGVHLSRAIEHSIEERLISSRLYIERNDQTSKEVVVSVDAVKKRAELICDCIHQLREKYSGHCGKDEIDEEFIHRAGFIARNIHILKRQLKSTYDKLPWEEIEFCVVNFISSRIKLLEFNAVSVIVVDKDKLLKHLGNFARALRDELLKLRDKDVNSKFPKAHAQTSVRNHCVAKVRQLYSCFEELYKDHEMIKTVFSLKRIESYVEVAIAIDLEERKDVGKLAIERTLQVIGESLKNTLESPNVSDDVHKLLLFSAPRNLREIINSLRDSLSHSHTLNNKMALEEIKDPGFFSKIQNDLKKIAVEVGYILYERKLHALEQFGKNFLDCKDTVEVRKLTDNHFDVNFGDGKLEVDEMKEIDKASKLIVQLKKDIVNPTEIEIGFLQKSEEILATQRSKLKTVKQQYFQKFAFVNNYTWNEFNLKTIKILASTLIRPDAQQISTGELFQLLLKIINRPQNISVFHMFYEIYCCIAYEGNRIKAVTDFREKLESKSVPKDVESLAVEKLENGLEEILIGLQEKDKMKVLQNLQDKKQMHISKVKLSGYLACYDPSLQHECKSLFDSLKVKKAKANIFHDMFSKGNLASCKKLVDDIRDDYKILLSSMKNAIDGERFEDIHKIITDFVKSTVKNAVVKERLIAEPQQNYFNTRLELLKGLIPRCTDTLELIATYKKDTVLQYALEMLVLELTEILGNLSYFGDNRLFLDRSSPILIGKCLRNYLAHGDWLIDTLPFDTSLAVLVGAFHLVKQGTDLITKKNVLIGQQIHGELQDLSSMTTNYSRLLASIVQQRALFIASEEADLEKVKYCIQNGADITARSIRGWSAVHFAACGGNKEVMRYLLDQNLNIEYCDLFHRSPLQIAVESGNEDIVTYLVEEKKMKLCDVDIWGRSLLHAAVQNDRENIVAWLLSTDTFDIHAGCQYGKTPVHYAARSGNKNIICTLIAKGAKVDCLDKHGLSPLHFAALNGHLDVVLELINNCALVDSLNKCNFTPLHCAVSNGHVDVALALIDKRSNLDALAKNVSSPFAMAIGFGNKDMVLMLMKKGANVDELPYLHLAAEYGHDDIINVLLEHGAVVNARDEDHMTPLFNAASRGHCNAINALISKGAVVNVSTETKRTPLHESALKGHKEACVALIENGATIDFKDNDGNSALHMAARNGYPDIILELLHQGAYVNLRNVQGITPLHLAAFHGALSAVRTLCGNGAQVNAQCDVGTTPLHVAVIGGHDDIVRELLASGASIEHLDQNNKCPLTYAAQHGHKHILLLLAENGASVNSLVEGVYSPLHFAALEGYDDIVAALLDKGACINTVVNGVTPLFLASTHGHEEVTIRLLDAGAEVNVRGFGNMTPLHAAVIRNSVQVIAALLNRGSDVNGEYEHRVTLLHRAAEIGTKEVVDALLEKGANVDAQDDNLVTPLHNAAMRGHFHVVALLLQNGASVDVTETAKRTPLFYAMETDNRDVAVALLTNNADVNFRMDDGCTPLHYAAARGHNAMVIVLLDFGAKINAQNFNMATPLHLAAENNKIDVAFTLLERGGQVNAEDKDGWTPLHIAAMRDCKDVAAVLLVKGASVNSTCANGNTALHIASINNRKGSIQALLDHGADIDAQGSNGYTALHIAVKRKYDDVVLALLANGAFVDAKDENDVSPLHYAACNNSTSIVLTLLRYGATINAREIDSWTPLHFAVRSGSLDALIALLDNGAIIESPNISDITPLLLASHFGHKDIVMTLLNHGANIEAMGCPDQGPHMTALHFAAANGHREVVVLLIERGANIKAVTSDGYTALGLAIKSSHFKIAKDLFSYERFLLWQPQIKLLLRALGIETRNT